MSDLSTNAKPLAGKVGVVFGVASRRSIAWAIAQAWHDAGATLIFNYQGERVKENVEDLVSTFGADVALHPCDVSRDAEVADFFKFVATKTDHIDLLLHSVAYAPKEALEGEFVNTTRAAFAQALDISAYSLIEVTRAALPFMKKGGSVMTMSYYGAEKVVPNYNVMGVAKSALESSVRYLAANLGTKKIRVNAISAGPVNTLAARGIAGFTKMLDYCAQRSPLRRNVDLPELGATGVFLASDGATAITGQTIYVDCGYSVIGM